MKFKHIHIKNFQQLVPSWAGDVFGVARMIDRQLDKPEFRKIIPTGGQLFGDLKYTLNIDFTVEDWTIQLSEPDGSEGSDEHCGKLLIKTRTIYGAPAQIDVPLNPVFKGFPSIEGMHCIYCHALQTDTALPYIGISKRPWHVRYAQHVSSARSGSHYLFHRAIRDHRDVEIVHRVLFTGLSQEYAFEIEELFVEAFSLYPLGLNMIPGGNAGIRYLHKLGIQAQTVDDRDHAMQELAARETLNGSPNPLCAARWASDQDFVERVICGHSGRLTADQVRAIRLQATFGFTASRIKEIVGARNIRQVTGVLSDRHYSRIAGGVA